MIASSETTIVSKPEREGIEPADARAREADVQHDPDEEDPDVDEQERQAAAEVADPVGDLHDPGALVLRLRVDVARGAVAKELAVSRRRWPIAARRSIAAAGCRRKNSVEVAAVDDQRLEVCGHHAPKPCADPPSRSEISPKKSPARAVSSTMRSPVSFLKKSSTSPVRTT